MKNTIAFLSSSSLLIPELQRRLRSGGTVALMQNQCHDQMDTPHVNQGCQGGLSRIDNKGGSADVSCFLRPPVWLTYGINLSSHSLRLQKWTLTSLPSLSPLVKLVSLLALPVAQPMPCLCSGSAVLLILFLKPYPAKDPLILMVVQHDPH